MTRSPSPFAPNVQRAGDFWARLKEVDRFFEGRSREHKTLRRLVEKLEKAKIPYVVLNGFAVNAHHYERMTRDVDILLTRRGFEEFRRRFVPRSYDPVPGRVRRFLDRRHRVMIDVLVMGLFPGTGQPGPIAFPDPADVAQTIDDVPVIQLRSLIELKLAARRHRDFGDVVELIRFNNLDASFAQQLHPSVRRDYIECFEEKCREDEYEARQD